MPVGEIRITGDKETARAFAKARSGEAKAFKDGLKKAAEPVTDEAKSSIGRYTGASVNTIRPRASGLSVYVRQNARKVTGQRGDFGALQMRRLIEAADKHESEVAERVEDAIGDLIREAGF